MRPTAYRSAAALAAFLLAAPLAARAQEEEDRPRPPSARRGDERSDRGDREDREDRGDRRRPVDRYDRSDRERRAEPARPARPPRADDRAPYQRQPPPSPYYAPGPRYAPGPYAPAPRYAPAPAPYEAPRHGYWSRGWGYGYAPIYGRPVTRSAGRYDDGREVLSGWLAVTGAGSENGGTGGVSLGLEGPLVGVRLSADGVAPDRVDGASTLGNRTAFGYATAAVTVAVISDETFRLRLELGGAMLSLPADSGTVSAPYAGTTVFGPSLGVSGQLGLVGPLGLEAHVRAMPTTVPVIDSGLGLVLRGGPLALSAGWRSFDVSGDGVKGPSAHVSGPELGLAFAF